MSSAGTTGQPKRDRIIDAAIEVFAVKGFASARISDIARGAHVADGTIYLYFRNKEDILLTIFEEKMEGVLDGLRQALDGIDDPLDRIHAYARFHFQHLQADPSLSRVFQVELRQSHLFFHGYRPEKLWQYLQVFEDLVSEGQRRGLLRSNIDPFLIKWAFFGALDELAIQWVLARKRDRFNLELAADQVVEIFLRGMVAPDQAIPSPNDPSASHSSHSDGVAGAGSSSSTTNSDPT